MNANIVPVDKDLYSALARTIFQPTFAMIRLVHHKCGITMRLFGFARRLRRVVGRYRVGSHAGHFGGNWVDWMSSRDFDFFCVQKIERQSNKVHSRMQKKYDWKTNSRVKGFYLNFFFQNFWRSSFGDKGEGIFSLICSIISKLVILKLWKNIILTLTVIPFIWCHTIVCFFLFFCLALYLLK